MFQIRGVLVGIRSKVRFKVKDEDLQAQSFSSKDLFVGVRYTGGGSTERDDCLDKSFVVSRVDNLRVKPFGVSLHEDSRHGRQVDFS